MPLTLSPLPRPQADLCGMSDARGPVGLLEVLPKAGLVYSEKGNLSEVLCKPKIMAIKSPTLEKLEEMEGEMAQSIEREAAAAAAAAAAATAAAATADL